MKTELIHSLTTTFEGHAQQTEGGIEFWLARDLQHLLGYAEWRNFLTVVSKAKVACEVSGHPVSDHFVDVTKMVDLGSGSQREVDDLMLTRYACYLIAQNGDPKKQEIAFAQTYFAVQTRRAELIEQRLLDAERISARKKLTTTDKELSDVIFEQAGNNQDFALIRSKGAYRRRCALTGESTLPVLEAAHILPFAESGPNDVANGLLLRSDFHKLFDLGMITVTPEFRVEVSPRIREEWFNGKAYYRLHGQELANLPASSSERPNPTFLRWHNESRYQH